jgi:hypothetical protein
MDSSLDIPEVVNDEEDIVESESTSPVSSGCHAKDEALISFRKLFIVSLNDTRRKITTCSLDEVNRSNGV